MRTWILTIAVLALALPARAQTNPCDTVQVGVPTAGTIDTNKQYVLGWCQKDDPTQGAISFKEYRDGAFFALLAPVSGAVSAISGYREYFVSSRIEATPGAVTITLSAVNQDGRESLEKSPPFTLTVVRAAPTAPTGLRAIQ